MKRMPDAAAPKETFLDRLRFRRHLRVFPVNDPVTLFVRGSQCRVVVGYHELDHVEIYASLYAAFGMRLIVEQDEAGVYVVLKRRRILGLFSSSEVTIIIPRYCHLAFTLTPGEVRLEELNGTLEIPPFARESVKPTLEITPDHRQLSAEQVRHLSSGE